MCTPISKRDSTMRMRPPCRGLTPAIGAALLILAGMSLAAVAGPIGFGKVEGPRSYGQVATHGALVPPADNHNMAALPNLAWDSPFFITGVVGPPGRVTVAHRARHKVAVCPGEAAPAPWWTPPPISAPPIPAGVSWAGLRGKVRHPGPWNHDDYFAELLAVRYWGPPLFRVVGYTYASSGIHDPDTCSARGGALTGDQVVPPPSTPPTSYGSVALAHDGGTNTFAVSVAVQGIVPQDLIAASLHVGAPGQVGPIIFALGPGMAWEPLEGGLLGRVVTDAVFPPEYVPALLEGNVYVAIYTLERPQGELRAQLGDLPLAPPSTGDMDCDGDVDFDDIDPFVLALSGEVAYQLVYPDCDWIRADCNEDGGVTFDDIDPFVALIGQ